MFASGFEFGIFWVTLYVLCGAGTFADNVNKPVHELPLVFREPGVGLFLFFVFLWPVWFVMSILAAFALFKHPKYMMKQLWEVSIQINGIGWVGAIVFVSWLGASAFTTGWLKVVIFYVFISSVYLILGKLIKRELH